MFIWVAPYKEQSLSQYCLVRLDWNVICAAQYQPCWIKSSVEVWYALHFIVLTAVVMNILNVCSLFFSFFIYKKCGGGCVESMFCFKISLKIARINCNFEAWFCTVGFVCVQGIVMIVPASLIETEECKRNRLGSWNPILQQQKTLLVNKREQNPVFGLHPQRLPGRCC